MSKRFYIKTKYGFPIIVDRRGENIGAFQSQFDYAVVETLTEKLNSFDDEVKRLQEEQNQYFVKVMDLLLKYQHLFNQEMAIEVFNDLGIELDEWFE